MNTFKSILCTAGLYEHSLLCLVLGGSINEQAYGVFQILRFY